MRGFHPMMLQGALAQGPSPVMDSRRLFRGPVPPGTGQMSPIGMLNQGPAQPPPQRPTDAFEEMQRRLRELSPNPKDRSVASHVGSVLLPAMVGGIFGGSARDAMLYGVGSAAFNFNSELGEFEETEAAIAEAAASLPQQEANYDLTRARTNEALTFEGLSRIGSPNYQTWIDLGMPGLDDPENATPEQASEAFNKWARSYADASGANKILNSPFGDQMVRPGGQEVASTLGPLSPQGIEASGEKAGVESSATEVWKLNEQQYSLLNDLNYDMSMTLDSLENLEKKIMAGPETGPAAQWKAYVDPELQELRSLYSDAVLAKASMARASGVTFGAMTIAEWQMLANTVSQLGNTKKGNLAIVRNMKAKLKRQIYMNERRLQSIPENSPGRAPPMNTPGPDQGTTRPSGSRLVPLKEPGQ